MEREALLLFKCISVNHLRELYFMGIVCVTESRFMLLHLLPLSLSGVHSSQLTSIIHTWGKNIFWTQSIKKLSPPPSPHCFLNIIVSCEILLAFPCADVETEGFISCDSQLKHWITNSLPVAFQIGEMDLYWNTDEHWLYSSLVQMPAIPHPTDSPLFLYYTEEYVIKSGHWCINAALPGIL